MATNKIRTGTPIVGVDLFDVNTPYGPEVGTTVDGTDGHLYMRVKASAAIASAAVCVLTENANPVLNTMATGAGSWTAPTITGGLALNDVAWFKKTAI